MMESRDSFYNELIRKIDEKDIAYSLLLAIKHKYYRLYIHCLNVAYGSYYLARGLDLQEDECQVIALGALLHDVGKINISSKILYKPGKLDDSEWQIIRNHPQYGVNLLVASKYSSLVRNIILYHHERYDGKGYINGLKGCNIPQHAQIVSIVDAFDAMVAFRSYKNTLSLESAQGELRNNKYKQFNGLYVDKFLEISADIYECFREEDTIWEKEQANSEVTDMPTWFEIADQLDNLGIMLLDKKEQVYYCNEYAAKSRNKVKHELYGESFYSLQKPHRVQMLKDKFSKIHRGESSGWSRLMAAKGKYIKNQYVSITNKDNKHAGTLLLTTDVTESENVLRSMEQTIDKLNILIQAGRLLADVDNLEQIISYMNLLVKKLWAVHNISFVFNKYNGQENFVISEKSQCSKAGLANIFKGYKQRKIDDIRYISLQQELIVRRLMYFKNNNTCLLEINFEKHTIFSDYDKQLLEGILNYLYIAIENHLLFVEMNQRAIRDNMTGLYNRHYLEIIKSNKNIDSKSVSLIVGDINNLKYFNDTYGHAAGDKLICNTAKFITDTICSQGIAFRTGGDEFLIILPDTNKLATQRLIQSITNKAQKWNEINRELPLSISFGYVIADNNNIEKLISIADQNMYQNKKMQKNKLLCNYN